MARSLPKLASNTARSAEGSIHLGRDLVVPAIGSAFALGFILMIGVARSACLLPLLSGLRHHRAMGKGESGRMNLRLRMSKKPHISAWLGPGLALGWLATLVTLVHSVGIALTAWGATVSVVLLGVLLVTRPQKAANRNGSADRKGPAVGPLGAAPSAASAKAAPPSAATGSGLGPGLISGTSTASAASPPAAELRTLTVEEVASVLRVDTELVITSISRGEFPGNRIGIHWRVDHEALTRWLQGTYRKG
jgi:excisionase family DNA binding protein